MSELRKFQHTSQALKERCVILLKPMEERLVGCSGFSQIESPLGGTRGIRTNHFQFLTGAKPAESKWRWLESTCTPETDQSAWAQATFASQKGNSPPRCYKRVLIDILNSSSKLSRSSAHMFFHSSLSSSSRVPDCWRPCGGSSKRQHFARSLLTFHICAPFATPHTCSSMILSF